MLHGCYLCTHLFLRTPGQTASLFSLPFGLRFFSGWWGLPSRGPPASLPRFPIPQLSLPSPRPALLWILPLGHRDVFLSLAALLRFPTKDVIFKVCKERTNERKKERPGERKPTPHLLGFLQSNNHILHIEKCDRHRIAKTLKKKRKKSQPNLFNADLKKKSIGRVRERILYIKEEEAPGSLENMDSAALEVLPYYDYPGVIFHLC